MTADLDLLRVEIETQWELDPAGRLVRVREAGGGPRSLPAAGAGWSTEQWAALMDGRLGPWAAVVDDGRVASLCHSARLAEQGAEAGVWTDPAFRGRGYAAAVTAAWAATLAGTGRRLFYSTGAGNRSSQRVAARLRLPCIGHLWKIARAE